MDQVYIGNREHDEVVRIRKEMKQLSERMHQLGQHLNRIQSECNHVFIETPIMRQCTKCMLAESVYY